LKNVPPGAGASGHIVAFTPRPHVLRTTMSRQGEDKYLVGDVTHTVTRWLIDLEIPGVKGVLALREVRGRDVPQGAAVAGGAVGPRLA
jgi:hypothetical protein